MTDSPFKGDRSPIQPIPITYFDPELAAKAWEEFQIACLEETAATLKRKVAHKRFMAAFMGGEA